MKTKLSIFLALSFTILSFSSFSSAKTINTIHFSSTIHKIMEKPHGLNPNLLKLGLQAYQWATIHSHVTKPYLTIVDFSIPSKYPRLWVINLNTNQILANTLVANGKNSGLFKGIRFSNRHGSNESSLGIYLTGPKYYGPVGLSMRIYGLQTGINSNALARNVVMHGNWYVSKQFARKYGRVGRSLGCFTLSKKKLPFIVHMIKNGSVLYAYAKNQPDAISFI